MTVAKGGRSNNLVWVLVAGMLAACSSAPAASGCTPGAQVACACPGGTSGVQVCQADRTLAACQCSGVDAGMDVAVVDASLPVDTSTAIDAGFAADVPQPVDRSPSCGSDRECSAFGLVCDLSRGVCVDCVRSQDCLVTGQVCASNRCVAGSDGGPPPVDVVTPPTDRGVIPDAGFPDAGFPDVGFPDVPPMGCVSTTVGNCCGVACSAPPNGTAACLGGRCGVGSCSTGYGDCDGNTSNGCETNTQTSAAHCGACGAACAADRVCQGAACVPCPDGQTLCAGRCTNLLIDPANCGACGTACPTRSNAASTCFFRVCGFACVPPYGDCDGEASNGCETMLSTADHCGMCATRCTLSQSCTRLSAATYRCL